MARSPPLLYGTRCVALLALKCSVSFAPVIALLPGNVRNALFPVLVALRARFPVYYRMLFLRFGFSTSLTLHSPPPQSPTVDLGQATKYILFSVLFCLLTGVLYSIINALGWVIGLLWRRNMSAVAPPPLCLTFQCTHLPHEGSEGVTADLGIGR